MIMMGLTIKNMKEWTWKKEMKLKGKCKSEIYNTEPKIKEFLVLYSILVNLIMRTIMTYKKWEFNSNIKKLEMMTSKMKKKVMKDIWILSKPKESSGNGSRSQELWDGSEKSSKGLFSVIKMTMETLFTPKSSNICVITINNLSKLIISTWVKLKLC